jgi:hypothetical protein
VGCNWFFPGCKWVATMFFCGCKSDFLVCKIVVFYYIDFFQFWNCEQSLFLLACSLFVCQIMVKIPSERTREIGLGKNVKREHMHTYFSVQKMDGSPQNNKEIRTLKHTLAGWLRFNKVSVAWDPVAPSLSMGVGFGTDWAHLCLRVWQHQGMANRSPQTCCSTCQLGLDTNVLAKQ